MHTLTLDFAFENETPDEELAAFVAPFVGVVATIVDASGPGGGWPVVRFDAATREVLEAVAVAYCDGDREQAAELMVT